MREWPMGVAADVSSCSVGTADVAQQLFAMVPYKIMLRSMLNPEHMMPLGSISKAFGNNFGEHDPLLGKLKRNEIAVWDGSAMDLISDLTKMMVTVTACDVQYGLALGGLIVVVADLMGNKKVLPSVAAKYVGFLRETAYQRSGREDVFKRVFVFDGCFFERAGGVLNSTGGVYVPPEATTGAKNGQVPDKDSTTPRKGAEKTCFNWNHERCIRGAACPYQHLCSHCRKGHPLVKCDKNRDKTVVPTSATGTQK